MSYHPTKLHHQSSTKYEKHEKYQQNANSNTNTYNQPQPHIHPRLPKVVTVTNSVALIVEYHPENIVLYLFHLSKFKVIPVQCHLQFPEIKLGSWVIVGLYQNGRIASICPKPLIANPQPTKIDESGNVMIFCTVSDGLHSGTDVGSKETLLNAMANKAEPNTAIWMKWVGIDKLKETSDNKVWEVSEIGKTESSDVHDFSEVEYRDCMEFARSRKRSEEPCRFPHATNMFVARHYGVIMEHNQEKNTLGVWSVGLTSEDVHNTKWPMEFNKTMQRMVPESGISVGQWINFDTTIELAEQMTSRSFRQSNKVTIHEFVHCSTPKGIAVSQIGKNVKMILTATYIMSTGHPMVYEIRDFGYVLAPRGSLISGGYMQLVLERVAYSLRKNYGFGWRVISSEPISPDTVNDENDENGLSGIQHQSISSTTILAREKFVLSTIDHERVHNHHNNGNGKRYPEWRDSIQIQNDASIKKRPQTTIMNVVGMVERVDLDKKSGILWAFDATSMEVQSAKSSYPNGTLTMMKEKSVHFVYLCDDPGFLVGANIVAHFTRKDEPPPKYNNRWILMSYSFKPPTYSYSISNNVLHVFDEISSNYLSPELDALRRPVYRGRNFGAIVDERGLLHQSVLSYYGPHPGLCVSIVRKKIANSKYDPNARQDPNSKYVPQETAFSWIVASIVRLGYQTTENPLKTMAQPLYIQQPFPSHPPGISQSTDTIKPLMVVEEQNLPTSSNSPIPPLLPEVTSPRRHKDRNIE